MIIYNVTSKLSTSIAKEWVEWMKQEHIPDLMKTGLFLDYRLCRLLDMDDSEGPTYTTQFFCDGFENYETYIQEHANQMREKGHQRFGNKYIAFQTVMEVEPE